jgi:hypothetical protein
MKYHGYYHDIPWILPLKIHYITIPNGFHRCSPLESPCPSVITAAKAAMQALIMALISRTGTWSMVI